ncbi:BREX system Lon protease-like protein BrxL [Carboxylicivirga sp. N1Y90]|uniref:BREX system Lon protease-like protein BrxL n=1 Tax=Carboxylicivirga fragile TaxID=3417571 RepID=UPI003D343858|nr:BREX system Lon protease-like protein BrxL [Marinilabiliaceae bacterium N1Y90]
MGLEQKIIKHFEGKVVRKDLTKFVKGNAVVPTYVLEYLLGQHCASSDDEIVTQGVEKVKEIIKKHFVHRDEAEAVKHDIVTKGNHRVIDKVSARLNDRRGIYEAEFANLGLKKVTISNDIIANHKKLLTSGVWCIVNLSYLGGDEGNDSPWVIESLKPIQISHVDLEEFKSLRSHFTKDEWIDLLMQSIGLNPEQFNFRGKLIQLTRMVSFCENNYNLIELGPKGTGKSHIYSELSPHGMLISGGEVTQAKLFVNNSNGQIGLVGYWDNVAFDEFAGITKRVDKNLVDTMKNYMANKSFSRGSSPYGAAASFSFVGNTMHSVTHMIKHSDLFEALPKAYHDSAFLDRIHCYIPGWEVQKLRNELFTDGNGFIADYLAEILKVLRKDDYSHLCSKYFELSEGITTRDRTAVLKTFSGLCKIIYPHGDCSKEEAKELLDFALEGRRRVKNQLAIIDETFSEVEFSYTNGTNKIAVLTLEEKQYPSLFKKEGDEETETYEEIPMVVERTTTPKEELLSGKHVVYEENTKGVSYEKLFAPYLKGARRITINDPYLRLFYQVKNLMEFIQMVHKNKTIGEDIEISVVTKYDEFKEQESEERFEQLKESIDGSGIVFDYEFDQSLSFHARSIETDTGWKISIDRGLDIFQPYDFKNPFNLANTLQEEREVKKFEITYLRE